MGVGEGVTLLNTVTSIASVTFGCILLAVGIVGYLFDHLNTVKRVAMIVLAILLFIPIYEAVYITSILNVIGAISGAAFILMEWKTSRDNSIYINDKQLERSN